MDHGPRLRGGEELEPPCRQSKKGANQYPCFWLSGLVPAQRALHVPRPADAPSWKLGGARAPWPADEDTGHLDVFTDGAGGPRAGHALLRRVAWAAVCLNEAALNRGGPIAMSAAIIGPWQGMNKPYRGPN